MGVFLSFILSFEQMVHILQVQLAAHLFVLINSLDVTMFFQGLVIFINLGLSLI